MFDLSIDEDYYKPIKTNDAFNKKYIEYKCKRDTNKTLSIKKYLNMIRPYLRDIINGHKTQGELNIYLGNHIIDYETQGKWKNQLTMVVDFISFKDSNETCIMYASTNNIEIMIGNEMDKNIRILNINI